MGLYRNIKDKLELVKLSLGAGMVAGDDLIQGPSSNDSNNIEINQRVNGGGFLEDVVEGKLTQQVEEARDIMYRIFKESDKYNASEYVKNNIIIEQNEDGTIKDFTLKKDEDGKYGHVNKKTLADYAKHADVYNEGNIPIRVIQDNFIIRNNDIFFVNDSDNEDTNGIKKNLIKSFTSLYDYEVTLTINRDGFRPRFDIEKLVTKMVVRQEKGAERALVDLYLPSIASQFGKIDAIVISNLYSMFNSKNLRNDLIDFTTMEWYSEKAWNSEDLAHFKYDDIKPIDIISYDGNFVITFDCHIVNDGIDLSEKFKKAEVDKMYEQKAPWGDSISFITADRITENNNAIDFDNIASQIIKLDENSD